MLSQQPTYEGQMNFPKDRITKKNSTKKQESFNNIDVYKQQQMDHGIAIDLCTLWTTMK